MKEDIESLKLWFYDDSCRTISKEYVKNTLEQLDSYSINGFPRFINVGDGSYYLSKYISSFQIVKQ